MHQLTALEIRRKFTKGEVQAETIARYFLDRIALYDKNIGAFVDLFDERMMHKARLLDQKRAAGGPLGKLAAVPIALKDNIHVRGELTTCASKCLLNSRAPFDATVTRLLEHEDALLIGKTNMDEFAMGSSTEYSALKLTRNPWNQTCSPGGSSGGSAAAVAARFCPIALGSDTGGSIRQPAAFCGVTGFKPTYGRVSRFGLVGLGSSMDQIGPLTHNTVDAALVMEVIGRPCAHDATSLASPPEDYLSCMAQPISGVKIGVFPELLQNIHPETKYYFEAALEVYRDLGAKLIEINLGMLKYSMAAYSILGAAEASISLGKFDAIWNGKLSERSEPSNEIPALSRTENLGMEVKRRILLGAIVLSSGFQDEYYKQAQKVRTLIIREYQHAFTELCDLIATPTSPFPTFDLGSIKDPAQMYLADMYTIGSNLAGLPAISVPCGFSSDNKPLGLQLIGPQKEDRRVLRTGHAFEQATAYHRAIPGLA